MKAIFRIVFVVIIGSGIGCTKRREVSFPEGYLGAAGESARAVSNSLVKFAESAPDLNRPIPIKDSGNIMTSMTSLLGVSPSKQGDSELADGELSTVQIYELNKTSFALNGNASEVNSGMFMSSTALAGGVCRDLYNKEKSMASGARVYYQDVDLSSESVVDFMAKRQGVVDRLALGVWGRKPSSVEYQSLDAALQEAGLDTGPHSRNQVREALLVICSGILGSFSGVQN